MDRDELAEKILFLNNGDKITGLTINPFKFETDEGGDEDES